jgi:deoxyadenosine/deoxycytidine kinase
MFEMGDLNQKKMHIAISGNIGAGKVSLAEKLANHYHMQVIFEEVAKNPYLGDFYMDMARWAFHIQVFFLNSRFRQNLRIRETTNNVIQGRTVYEDAFVFAKNLNQAGLLNDRDYQTYLDIYQTIKPFVTPPNLMIYLRTGIPKLVRNIQERSRAFENSIRLDYLRDLNNLYEQWITEYKESNLLVIEADKIDFINNVEDFAYIVRLIESEIHGLFSNKKPTG